VYFFFRTLQIGHGDGICARHVCFRGRDTLKTNNLILRQLFIKYAQTDPTDKLTLRQKEIWPRSISNHKKEYCTERDRMYLGIHRKRMTCGKNILV
jgi:hypothetical protein